MIEPTDVEPESEPVHRGNILKLWANTTTMNLNSMIYTNIRQSPYFKNNLSELTTYHEVVDEIYYKVEHLEPWERGSRKTDGQSGMCGGVRGVGAGGIVSTAYCLLFKLFVLKLTRKQLKSLLDHPDSPYIRALGFMYIRYCLQPEDLWTWYEPYIEDEEAVDVKAGGGTTMTIGSILQHWLTRIDWFSTLFPRIPVPVEKKIKERLRLYRESKLATARQNQIDLALAAREKMAESEKDSERQWGSHSVHNRDSAPPRPNERRRSREREHERPWTSEERTDNRGREHNANRDRDRLKARERDRSRERERTDHKGVSCDTFGRDLDRKSEVHDRHHHHKSHTSHKSHHHHREEPNEKDRQHSKKSSNRHRSRSVSRKRHEHESSFERDLKRARQRQERKDTY